LGVSPLRGRAFLPEEDKTGGNPVAVVSDAFWQRRYGRNEAAVGSGLTLNNKNYTIVGVMPASFRFPNEFDIWVPLALDPVKENQGDWFSLVEVIGRLRPGANTDRAQRELGLLSQQASQHFKEVPEPSTLEILPLHQFLVAGVRRTVLVLWGAVGLVMLIACVNVASLMLSRTVGRQREMAVRAAVGARRWQLIRQLLIESMLLGLVGGGLGVLVALWCRSVIASLVPEGLTSSIHDVGSSKMDWRVFGFTLGLSLLTGLIFGLVPSLSASKPNLIKTLRENSLSNLVGFGLRSVRGWLVVAELALAMVLLLAAGLLVRSFNQLLAVDLGFDRENVLTVRVDLPRSSYPKPEQTTLFHQQLLERVKALPGVQSAAEVSHKPLAGFSMIAFMEIEGLPKLERPKDKPVAAGVVSPDYFQTLKIPLVFGRFNDERDRKGAPEVAIVNQAFARRFFGNADPTGKRISFGCEESLCRTIVGVVGNIRQESLTEDVYSEVYVPAGQMPLNGMTLLVRSASDPSNLVSSIRHTVFGLDKSQPVYAVKTLEQRVAETVAVSRSLMLLFAGFAMLALVLASVGIYGIVSYSVSQRTREIGIRMALGAQRADVLKLIMRNGVILAVTGVAFGVGGAYALTRFLTTLLFGITPTDTKTFLLVSLGLFVIAVAACLVPARRATKVDPLVALRYE
jgi:predicted permease